MRPAETFVPRKFFHNLHGSCDWPRDAAYRVYNTVSGNYYYVTWAEVHSKRREYQSERLALKRYCDPPLIRPCYVWVFFNPHWIYHGWHCYVVTRRDSIGVTFRSFSETLALSIMQSVPCGILPDVAHFKRWMEEFADAHPRRKTPEGPGKEGSIVGWLKGGRRGGEFSLERPDGA